MARIPEWAIYIVHAITSCFREFMEIAAEQLEHLDLGRLPLSLDILDGYEVTAGALYSVSKKS